MEHTFYSEEEIRTSYEAKLEEIRKHLEKLERWKEHRIRDYTRANTFLIRKTLELGAEHPEVIRIREAFKRRENRIEVILSNEEYFYYQIPFRRMVQYLPDKPGDDFDKEAYLEEEPTYHDAWDE